MQKLSVIVPIYNVEKYLPKCLDSLQAQTYKNLEIILIDDGSPDGCGRICDEYAKYDARFVVIHKPNGGLSSAWNYGLDCVTGDYLTFVDSDDWIDNNYYERIFKLTGEKSFDIFLANGHIIETPDGEHHEVHTFAESFIAKGRDEKNSLLVRTLARTRAADGELYRDLGVVWDKVYRTAFIKECHIQFTSSLVTKCAWIDALFVFQAIDQASVIFGGNVIGYHFRVVDFSATRKYNPNLPIAYEAFFDELNEYMHKHWKIHSGGGYRSSIISGN